MEGSKGQYGVSQRTIQKIFNLLHERHQQYMEKQSGMEPSSRFEYKIEVGMLEIYNDDGKIPACVAFVIYRLTYLLSIWP